MPLPSGDISDEDRERIRQHVLGLNLTQASSQNANDIMSIYGHPSGENVAQTYDKYRQQAEQPIADAQARRKRAMEDVEFAPKEAAAEQIRQASDPNHPYSQFVRKFRANQMREEASAYPKMADGTEHPGAGFLRKSADELEDPNVGGKLSAVQVGQIVQAHGLDMSAAHIAAQQEIARLKTEAEGKRAAATDDREKTKEIREEAHQAETERQGRQGLALKEKELNLKENKSSIRLSHPQEKLAQNLADLGVALQNLEDAKTIVDDPSVPFGPAAEMKWQLASKAGVGMDPDVADKYNTAHMAIAAAQAEARLKTMGGSVRDNQFIMKQLAPMMIHRGLDPSHPDDMAEDKKTVQVKVRNMINYLRKHLHAKISELRTDPVTHESLDDITLNRELVARGMPQAEADFILPTAKQATAESKAKPEAAASGEPQLGVVNKEHVQAAAETLRNPKKSAKEKAGAKRYLDSVQGKPTPP